MKWYDWVLLICVVMPLGVWVLSWFIGPFFAYHATLHRTSKKKWARGVDNAFEGTDTELFIKGTAWHEAHAKYQRDVHIVRDGLNLYGEFYDLGTDRCVMVLPGRREGLCGSYYYAIPYARKGLSVLVIDPRAHGDSDGEFNTVGFEEHKDAMAWLRFLQQECGVRSVVLHGICIGCASGIYALTSDECPDIVEGIVTDGMFTNFFHSMYHRMRAYKIPSMPGLDILLLNCWMRFYTGHSMRVGPIDYIDRLRHPILMLHSKEDRYSTPDQAEKLFQKAGSPQKKLVWFEKGAHSQLRFTDTERYDNAIEQFLESLETAKV